MIEPTGNLSTDLLRYGSRIKKTIVNLILYPAPYGALTPLWAGTSLEGKDFNGKYLIPWARLGEPAIETQDPNVGSELWAWLEEQTRDV